VTSLPVVGGVTSGLLGSTPTGSITSPVVGAVDQVVGGVTGIVTGGGGAGGGGSTPPTSPGGGSETPPADPGTGAGGGTGTAPDAGSGTTGDGGSTVVSAGTPAADQPQVAAPAAPLTESRERTSGDRTNASAAAGAAAGQPFVAPAHSAVPTPGAPGPDPAADTPASTGGALGSSGSSGPGPSGDVASTWTPPAAPTALRPSPPTVVPRSAPPGDHEVSPG
jgi:hypothetical protein